MRRNLLIFPNLVLNDIMSITVRVFQPTAPDYMEVNVWSLAPVEEDRQAGAVTAVVQFSGIPRPRRVRDA